MNVFIPIEGIIEHYNANKELVNSKVIVEGFDFKKGINTLSKEIKYIKLVFNVPNAGHGAWSTELGAFQRIDSLTFEGNSCWVPCEIWVD